MLALVMLIVAGCATPGPLHRYTLARATSDRVRDDAAGSAAEVPSFLGSGETITGFAYDPFTDHFFLRLAPGNRMRVVDRPARAIKREFPLAGAPSTGGGDLAVKPRNGHLFLLHPTEAAVIEVTRFGKHVRTLTLAGAPAPARGIAYDSERDQLWILVAGSMARVACYDLRGARLRDIPLERPVGDALAFDAEKREFHAPLADGNGLGVFDEQGRLQRTEASTAAFIDVGPRSFLRVF